MHTRMRVVPRYPVKSPSDFLTSGFRPFFLGAGIVAVVDMALWLAAYSGMGVIPTFYPATAWHAREMLFGYGAAAIAGFLLTAVAAWTGRAPVAGRSLLNLFALWLAGRIAMTMASGVAPVASAFVDVLFFPALLIVVAREIIAGGNWRNLPVCGAVGLLAIANGMTHVDFLWEDDPSGQGIRLGLSVHVCLIVLIGGRIVPNFTNNWFKRAGSSSRSTTFSYFDLVVILLTAVAVGSWILSPESRTSGLLLANAAIGNALRLVRWNGYNASAEPLVWILHFGYAWVPMGLLLLGLSLLQPAIPSDAGLHALSAGAIGTMTVAVMTRATLGHTGRTLHADGATFCIYTLTIFAAVARVVAAFPVEHQIQLLFLAGIQWCAAFTLFSIRYGALILGYGWKGSGR